MALQLQRSARTIAPASSKLYAGGITSKRCIRARAEGEATPTSAVQDVKVRLAIYSIAGAAVLLKLQLCLNSYGR